MVFFLVRRCVCDAQTQASTWDPTMVPDSVSDFILFMIQQILERQGVFAHLGLFVACLHTIQQDQATCVRGMGIGDCGSWVQRLGTHVGHRQWTLAMARCLGMEVVS